MNEQDKRLADIAGIIIRAFNGSYKPHIFDMYKFDMDYTVSHSEDGYALLFYSDVIIKEKNIDAFVEQVFALLGEGSGVRWTSVCDSKAVKDALSKYFKADDIKADISIELGPMKSLIEGIAEQSVRVTVSPPDQLDLWTLMEEKGCIYYDRNWWYINL